MRTEFDGWYAKDPQRIASIWKSAIFVPDANILLHCVRHPKQVRDELLRLFEVLGDSLWIPYQVGLEFHRNRLDVERSALDAYDEIVRDCQKSMDQARDRLRQLRAHPTINIERELVALDMHMSDFRQRIEVSRKEHPIDDLPAVFDRLNTLLDGKVGTKWAAEDLAKLKKDGEARYGKQVPPGYLDAKKDGDDYRKYGDLIIWRDMMAKSKEDKRPVIFITDDVKEDWWWIHKGRKIGPRPELIEEFAAETSQDFHMYEFSNFIRTAATHHPEFEDDLEVVEKSLMQDTEARKRRSLLEDETTASEEIESLEDEREEIISTLSGALNAKSRARAHDDLEHLRTRKREIDERLQTLKSL